MHSCPACDQACYCDMDDTDLGDDAAIDCVHACDPEPNEDDDFELSAPDPANESRNHRPMTQQPEHHCHAYECQRQVPPRLLMCARHWAMVPREIQSQVWKHYRPGQEIDKNPTGAYLMVQRAAVWAVFVAEGRCGWPDVPEVGSREYMIGPAVLGNGRLF